MSASGRGRTPRSSRPRPRPRGRSWARHAASWSRWRRASASSCSSCRTSPIRARRRRQGEQPGRPRVGREAGLPRGDRGPRGYRHAPRPDRLRARDQARRRGFWLYRGGARRLEWALLDFFIAEHFADGYQFMLPAAPAARVGGLRRRAVPEVLRRRVPPRDRGGRAPRFLLPTAETAILSVFADEVLNGDELPKKVFAYTPCYRREAGGYRTEERGTVRGHQFNKVELFQFVRPEQASRPSRSWSRRPSGSVRELGLHYRRRCSRRRTPAPRWRSPIDVEVWMPSMGGTRRSPRSPTRATTRPVAPTSSTACPTRSARVRAHAERAPRSRPAAVPALLEQHLQPDGR